MTDSERILALEADVRELKHKLDCQQIALLKLSEMNKSFYASMTALQRAVEASNVHRN
jgi:hypothetical protein